MNEQEQDANVGVVEVARKQLAKVVSDGLMDGEGSLPEASEEVNQASRAVVAAFQQKFGRIWLGRINRYGWNQAPTWEPGEVSTPTFGADFVIPVQDEELVRLIKERDEATYTGVAEDAKRVEAITARVHAIGGEVLVWC